MRGEIEFGRGKSEGTRKSEGTMKISRQYTEIQTRVGNVSTNMRFFLPLDLGVHTARLRRCMAQSYLHGVIISLRMGSSGRCQDLFLVARDLKRAEP